MYALILHTVVCQLYFKKAGEESLQQLQSFFLCELGVQVFVEITPHSS